MPNWLSIDENFMISGFAENNEVGEHNIQFKIEDEYQSFAEYSLDLSIFNTNDAPVLEAPNDLTATR